MEETQDKIPVSSTGKHPMFEEPALNSFADKASKDLKAKPADKLTANDKFVLDLTKTLPLMDLLRDGYMTCTLEIAQGVKATFRSLVYKQVEAIAKDVSGFQQQRDIQKIGEKERITWQPGFDEVKAYQVKRTLAESLLAIGDKSPGQVSGERMSFLDGLDGMFVNALYRKMQQFFTATSLLFPSDYQKELLDTLKKV
jgi:hypothetical protein